jgi:hypothetical protein
MNCGFGGPQRSILTHRESRFRAVHAILCMRGLSLRDLKSPEYSGLLPAVRCARHQRQVCPALRSPEGWVQLSITAFSPENRASEYVFLWASGVDDDGLIFNRAHEPKMRVAFLTTPGFPELAYPARSFVGSEPEATPAAGRK